MGLDDSDSSLLWALLLAADPQNNGKIDRPRAMTSNSMENLEMKCVEMEFDAVPHSQRSRAELRVVFRFSVSKRW